MLLLLLRSRGVVWCLKNALGGFEPAIEFSPRRRIARWRRSFTTRGQHFIATHRGISTSLGKLFLIDRDGVAVGALVTLFGYSGGL